MTFSGDYMKRKTSDFALVLVVVSCLVLSMTSCSPSKRITIAGDKWGVDVVLDEKRDNIESIYIEGHPDAMSVTSGTTPEGANFIKFTKR